MKATKKPIVISYRLATSVEVINTLEGPVTAEVGDAIITGVKGEQYPVPRPNFDDWYTIVEPGKAFKKAMTVEVEQLTAPREVTVGWSANPIHGDVGDYFITYGPNNFGIVRKDIFLETYDIVK